MSRRDLARVGRGEREADGLSRARRRDYRARLDESRARGRHGGEGDGAACQDRPRRFRVGPRQQVAGGTAVLRSAEYLRDVARLRDRADGRDLPAPDPAKPSWPGWAISRPERPPYIGL